MKHIAAAMRSSQIKRQLEVVFVSMSAQIRGNEKRDTASRKSFRITFEQVVYLVSVSLPHEDPRTDHELAQAWLRSGSEAAARELVQRLHPRVASIARGHLARRESIEDLVQEAFMRVFDNLPRYDFRAPL